MNFTQLKLFPGCQRNEHLNEFILLKGNNYKVGF